MSSIIKVDTVQDQDGNNIINENANTITIGASGDTITIPSGATLVNNGTATGFFEGIAWQSVVTAATLTTVAGRGYPINTTSNTCTVTLPATPSAGDQVQLVDYAGTFDTNALTINPNGANILGQASNVVVVKDREAITLTYIDATQGWLPSSGYQESTQGISIPYSADFLVIAGGGSGADGNGGGAGGGAGGYRTSTQTISQGTVITITVGDGGADQPSGAVTGNNGSNSSISGSGLTTITSAGGGGGGYYTGVGANGGSGGGGGGGGTYAGGLGDTPSTTPSQGNNGGTGFGSPSYAGGGGGGAGAVGGAANPSYGGDGGAGVASSITGSSVTRAGGGGGGTEYVTKGIGGSGGGGDGGQPSTSGTVGAVNTGSGGGGGGYNTPYRTGKAGGKGVVILSMPLANFSGTTTGSPTEATSGANKILTFTGTGSYTA